MATFVIGNKLLSFLRESSSFLFKTNLDSIDCIIDFFLSDLFFLLSGTKNGSFIEYVGEIGTRHTKASLGDVFEVH